MRIKNCYYLEEFLGAMIWIVFYMNKNNNNLYIEREKTFNKNVALHEF